MRLHLDKLLFGKLSFFIQHDIRDSNFTYIMKVCRNMYFIDFILRKFHLCSNEDG